MPINLKDHIKVIDGEEYVPLALVDQHVSETYGKEFESINKLMTKAFSDYNKSLKDIMND